MLDKISLNEVSDITGIAKTTIRDWITDDNPKYRLIAQERKKGKNYAFNENDVEKIVVFYIYKSSQTITSPPEKKLNEKKSKENNSTKIRVKETKELINEFNRKYNEQEPLEILSEISKRYNDVYHFFRESKKANKFEDKIEIYIKMIALISINLKSNFGIEDEIRKDTKKIGEGENEYEYEMVSKGETPIAIKFSESTIDRILNNYRKAYSHYFEKNTLSNYTLANMIQKPELLPNTKSKLLKDHRDYFNFFQEKLNHFSYEELDDNRNIERIKKEFYILSKEKFEEIFSSMQNIIKQLEILEIKKALKPITEKMTNLSEDQKEFHRNLPSRNYSDIFLCVDETLDFYNSPQGKLLNEYFKKHNLITEFFEYIKLYTNFSGYYEDNIDDIKFKLTRDLNFPIRCLGYDYEYKYHMLHNAFELIQNPEKMKKVRITEDKLLDTISKILAHGSFDVNSHYQGERLLKKVIATNNPNTVRVLKGYIDNIEESDLLSACYDQADTEGMIRGVLDCINDINTKAYYQAIYEGDYELVDILMKRVGSISKKYSIEMYLCIVGKAPKEVSKVLMNNIDKHSYNEDFFSNSPTKEEIKLSFLELSVLWNKIEILKENIDFLESLDKNNYLLEKILALLLRCNHVDIFKEIFEGKKFDPSRIFYIFIGTNEVLSTEITKETWTYMLETAFRDMDISKIVSNTHIHCYRPHESTIEGLAKEKFHFTYASIKFLEKLYDDTKKFKMAFKDAKNRLEECPNETTLCYMGLNEEYEDDPEAYIKKQDVLNKLFESNYKI